MIFVELVAASMMARSDSDVLKVSSCQRSMSSTSNQSNQAQDDSVLDIIKLQRSEPV